MKTKDDCRAHLINALHQQALETSSLISGLMLLVLAQHGPTVLHRISVEAEDALP
jgi:hypothetical protein